jgi:hypothetical protein
MSGWQKTMNSEQVRALEKMAEVLARKLQANPVLATLQAPAQLTVKHRNGEYRKQSFIGGAQFVFNSAYAGKRDGVILIGVPQEAVKDIRLVEVSMNKGAEHFGARFAGSINDFLTGAFERAEAELKAAADLALQEERERLEDPAFSSW